MHRAEVASVGRAVRVAVAGADLAVYGEAESHSQLVFREPLRADDTTDGIAVDIDRITAEREDID